MALTAVVLNVILKNEHHLCNKQPSYQKKKTKKNITVCILSSLKQPSARVFAQRFLQLELTSFD